MILTVNNLYSVLQLDQECLKCSVLQKITTGNTTISITSVKLTKNETLIKT